MTEYLRAHTHTRTAPNERPRGCKHHARMHAALEPHK
jgi:hypothetical protein